MKKKLTLEEVYKRLEHRNTNCGNQVFLFPENQEYIRYNDPLQFICDRGHIWKGTFNNTVYKKRGCKICDNKSKILTTHKMKERIKQRNLNSDNLVFLFPENQEYESSNKSLQFICDGGHIWKGTFNSTITRGAGCKICHFNSRKLTPEEIATSLRQRNSIAEYPVFLFPEDQQYKGYHNPLQFTCDKRHVWLGTFNNTIRLLEGCPNCSKRKFSHKQIYWLTQIEKNESIFIQHAKNGGEHRILGSKYFADGYCKQTHTIYEFHGNSFHGNPELFLPETFCHPFDKTLTAGELYTATVKKEQFIKNCGYNLVTMWENEFDEMYPNSKSDTT